MVCICLVSHLHPVLHISQQTSYLFGTTGAKSLYLPSVLKFTRSPLKALTEGSQYVGTSRMSLCVSLPIFFSVSLSLFLSLLLFSFFVSVTFPWLCAVCAETGAALWVVWEGRTENTERVRTCESLVFSSGKHPM